MTWTLANYLERRAREWPTNNPKVLVFFNAFFAFAAGAQFIYELEEGGHSILSTMLGYFLVALWLAMSLECSYFVLKALRRDQCRIDPES